MKNLNTFLITLTFFCFFSISISSKPFAGTEKVVKPKTDKELKQKLDGVAGIIVSDGSYSGKASGELTNIVNAYSGDYAGGNIILLLFNILKDMIAEMNEDKRYFLQKLHDMNEVGEAMGDYLRELNEQAARNRGSAKEIRRMVMDYKPVVLSLMEFEKKFKTSKFDRNWKLNLKPAKRLLQKNEDMRLFKLNLKRHIALVVKSINTLEKLYSAFNLKLQKLQSAMPSIKIRINADISGILK